MVIKRMEDDNPITTETRPTDIDEVRVFDANY